MRDLRLVRVTFRPPALPLPSGATAASADVTVATTSAPGTNEKLTRNRTHSPAFSRIYQDAVINYDPDEGRENAVVDLGGGRELVGSRYLIITDATMAGEADSLVAWKTDKGLLPKLVPPPAGVWTRYELKEYIDNAYNTWDIPPEFVLLLGDTEFVPTGGGTPKSDNFFAHVDGDDYLLDILVGRLPAETPSQCRTMIAKTLSYDRPWIHGDSDWPMSASLLLLEDGDASDEVYYANTWFAYDLMEAAGYSPIDTLFQGTSITANRVIESLSAGKGFVNYRGVSGDYWAAPFSIWPGNVQCGWKLPIVVSATCLSGNYYEDVAICEAFLRAGSEVDPRGGVAFFGTSTFGASYELSVMRGYLDEGFFAGAFGPNRTLGEACAAAKLNLFVHLDDREEYEGWNLLGDPELSLWTAETSLLAVEHDTIISLSSGTLAVSVTSGGAPVEGTEITLERMPDVYASGTTDAGGVAELPLSLVSACTLRLTAVAKNARPYVSSVRVLPNGPFVMVADRTVTDASGGNGDGLASPGESVRLSLALVNLGDQSALPVEARLSCPDEHATAVDSLVQFGAIEPDSTAWGPTDFLVAIDDGWGGGYDLPVTLTLSYGDSTNTIALPPLETVSGDLAVATVLLDDASPGGDGDGSLEPGEVAGIEVLLDCDAGDELTGITGVLSSRTSRVSVTSAVSAFPNADPGAQSANAGTPFIVSVAPDAAPGDARLFVRVAAEARNYAYAETLCLDLAVAEVAPLHPTGPDAYGYYAYDSSDTLYAAAPAYEWAEIAQPGPGVRLDDVSDASNGVAELDAPFDILCYGLLRQSLWVSSNGFVSVYPPNGAWRTNYDIPSLDGPPGMFAPFWDDLDPSAGGDVYAWFDPYEHRYIIEYDQVRHSGSSATETFQVVIYDPEYYDTPTGDAPIAFLYKDVGDPSGCTVGIENPYQTAGLRFLFDGDYGAYAAPLSDELAVLFTTAPPETLTFPWLVLDGVSLDDSERGNGDGVPDPGEELSLVIELRNDGPISATGLDLTLSAATPGIAIEDGVSSIDDIAAGGVGQNAGDPFAFGIDSAMQDSVATLWVRAATGSNTRQGAVRLDLSIGRPDEVISTELLMSPCYPNPSGGGTHVSFHMPAGGRAVVRVYDVSGRLVKTVDDSFREAGPQEAIWNGTNREGDAVAAGVYFVSVKAAGDSRTRKVVLLR
ncbi:MAG TPA: C25 family cysteine peptidase [bacterium]|nr:C25 family cysteine peptidase [bacterium]